MRKPQHDKATEATFRACDRSIVIKTTAHVSHRRGHGTAWPSVFSINLTEAARLRDEMTEILERENA